MTDRERFKRGPNGGLSLEDGTPLPMVIDAPTVDAHGGTYQTAHAVSEALGLTRAQFYGLLHGAVLRNDQQVAEWDERDGIGATDPTPGDTP
jgi:hypothetical protein